MLDDILDVIEMVIDAVIGARKYHQELNNELLALMRQAHERKSLSGSLISTAGVSPDSLCCPLTPQQLCAMRTCTVIKKNHLALDISEAKGFRTRHIVVLVTVVFEGISAAGTPVHIHLDKAPVHVTLGGKHPWVIKDITAHTMM